MKDSMMFESTLSISLKVINETQNKTEIIIFTLPLKKLIYIDILCMSGVYFLLNSIKKY